VSALVGMPIEYTYNCCMFLQIVTVFFSCRVFEWMCKTVCDLLMSKIVCVIDFTL